LLDAVLVNGAAAHALELDDGHTLGSAHPGAVVVPAVFGVAEKLGSSMSAVLEAIIVGYEVMLSIASAIHPRSRRRGFHNTAVAGVFGAAASAAKLLGLDAHEVCSCLGLAGSFAGGLLAFWNPGEKGGTDVKKLHPGKAARDGVLCAVAAAEGLRGPKSVFEGRAGVFSAFAGGDCMLKVPDVSMQEPEIMSVYFKPWPCCRSLHGPIALAIELRHQIAGRTDEIASVRVDTYSLASERSSRRAEGDDAQFSIPVAVATAFLAGDVSYDRLVGARADPAIYSLAERVSVDEDPEFSARYPSARPARLTVVMRDGTCFSAELEYPPGEPESPLPEHLLRDKFVGLCCPVIGRHRALELLHCLAEGGLEFACRDLLSLSCKEVVCPEASGTQMGVP
ncbi:MAG: MmgE/PrpD family protein, partial [Bacillota bacterium]